MMKNNCFVALILTHGRPDNVHTVKTLRKCGYTGDIIIVLDNIYGSSHSDNPKYPSDYIYAGFFDGNVSVLGDVSANGFFPRDGNGTVMNVLSDVWITNLDSPGKIYKQKIHIVKGMVVEMTNT